MSDLYNLKWDEHYSKVVLESFWSLLGQEVLTDCTLVCSTPSEAVQVHRLILSANSPYFRTLLKAHSSHPHPIIILHDVDVQVLRMLVTFMYRGEVNVSSSTFPLLLKTAENLQIIGLSQTTPPGHPTSSTAVPMDTTPPTLATPLCSTVTATPTQNHTTTHYSKKARILEGGGGNFFTERKFEGGGSGRSVSGGWGVGGGEQVEPLSLRTTPSTTPTAKKESLSAPSTPISSSHTHSHTHLDYYGNKDLNHYEDNTSGEEEESESEGEERGRSHRGRRRSGQGSGSNHQPTTTPPPPPLLPPQTPPLPTTPPSPVPCPYCDPSTQTTYTPTQLSLHMTTTHPNNSLPSNSSHGNSILCKFCSKPFPEVSSLIQHLPVHTGERPFKCEFCGKAFKLRHHMKDHARVHTGERPFRCGLCGKTFSRSTILKAHEKTHFPKGVGE